MTIKSKKYYSAPIINSIKLDSEISLILMTSPPPDPDSGTMEVVPPSPYSAPPSANSTPFGGNGPDYSDM